MPDPLNLYGMLFVSCFVSGAILGSVGRAVPGVTRWCAAYALLAAVCAFLFLVDSMPGPAAIVALSVLTFAALALLVQGTREFLGRPAVRRAESVAFVIVCVVLMYATWVSPNVRLRVALVSLVLAYGRIAIGALVWRHRPADGARYGYRFVVAAAWIGALVHLARAAMVALDVSATVTYVQSSPWSAVFVGLPILTLPCMSIGMTMLAHDRLVRRMEKLATVDELTGTLVRRAFMTKANDARSIALATGMPLSIAVLDLDNFKAINDGFGHAVGDRTLTHFAAVIAAQLRARDLFGRIGGEEFGIVFVDASESDAERLTDTLRLALETSPDNGVRCTLSAGVAGIERGATLEDAMARADAALYMAKALGRNRVIAAPDVAARKVEVPN